MNVVDWQASLPPLTLKARAPSRFLSPTLIGILGTLILHASVIQSVLVLGVRAQSKAPQAQGSADALAKSKGEPSDSLVLVALSAPAKLDQAALRLDASLPDLRKMKIK